MSIAVVTSTGALRRRLAAQLTKAFAAAGRDGTAALDARLLLAHALGVDATRLALDDDEPVDVEAEATATAFIERRIAGEPVARIVERCAFWGLEFDIGPETLVPRPDSETLVEAALAHVERGGLRHRAIELLDLGTGSGALLLALLSELPAAAGTATDKAPGAIAFARDNARRLRLSNRTRFVVGDWAEALRGGFDLVLANPPYVESAAIASLQIEVANYDPHIALDGGADGLDAYRAILADLDRLLTPCGRGFLEIGFGQARDVAKLAESEGFSAIFRRDLGGIERVVELCRIDNILAYRGDDRDG